MGIKISWSVLIAWLILIISGCRVADQINIVNYITKYPETKLDLTIKKFFGKFEDENLGPYHAKENCLIKKINDTRVFYCKIDQYKFYIGSNISPPNFEKNKINFLKFVETINHLLSENDYIYSLQISENINRSEIEKIVPYVLN